MKFSYTVGHAVLSFKGSPGFNVKWRYGYDLKEIINKI